LDSDDFTAIAHEGLAFMNPLAEEDVEEMIEALELEPGAHVLDLGCGKAEILLRIVERYPDVRATGLDNSPAVLAEARRQAEARVPESKVVLLEEDVREYAPEPGAFDLVVSTGGVSFRGGVGGTLAVLSGYVASGGKLLFGEGYWREEPTAEYLVALGAAREELKDYEGTIEAAVEAGLDLKRAVTSSVDDDFTRAIFQVPDANPSRSSIGFPRLRSARSRCASPSQRCRRRSPSCPLSAASPPSR